MKKKITCGNQSTIVFGSSVEECLLKAAKRFYPGEELGYYHGFDVMPADSKLLGYGNQKVYALRNKNGEVFGAFEAMEAVPLALSEMIAELQSIYDEHGDIYQPAIIDHDTSCRDRGHSAIQGWFVSEGRKEIIPY